MITSRNEVNDLVIASVGLTRTSYRFLIEQGLDLPNMHREGSLLYTLAVSSMINQIIKKESKIDVFVIKRVQTNKPISFFHSQKINLGTTDNPITVYCDSQGTHSEIDSIIALETDSSRPELANEIDIIESGFPFDPILVELLNDLSHYQMTKANASSLMNISVTRLSDDEMVRLCKGSWGFKNDVNTHILRRFLNTGTAGVKYYKVLGGWLTVSY